MTEPNQEEYVDAEKDSYKVGKPKESTLLEEAEAIIDSLPHTD